MRASEEGRGRSLAERLDMVLLYHVFMQSLRTLFKNDTLTFLSFGLRSGSGVISSSPKSFPVIKSLPKLM